MLYPIALIGARLSTGSWLSAIIGFLFLFIVFLATDVTMRSKNGDGIYIGALDIIGAPLFTCWFGYLVIIFIIIFMVIQTIVYGSRLLDKVKHIGNPEIPSVPVYLLLLLTYLITCILLYFI